MGDINAIAKSFVEYYYSIFDSNRSGLQSLYKDHSMMTWEGQQFMGGSAIVEKLASLPFQQVKHFVLTVDAQPSNPQGNALLVLVTGQVAIDNEPNKQHFSQTFQLVAEGSSQFYVFNDVFRLNYG